MKNKITKVVGAFLLSGAFGLSSAFAAENAAGVKEFMNLTVKTAKEAHDAAAAGSKDGCLSAIKQTKQYYKEVTGDAAGKPLQDAMKRLKEGQAACQADDLPGAAMVLKEVVVAMEKINSGSK